MNKLGIGTSRTNTKKVDKLYINRANLEEASKCKENKQTLGIGKVDIEKADKIQA